MSFLVIVYNSRLINIIIHKQVCCINIYWSRGFSDEDVVYYPGEKWTDSYSEFRIYWQDFSDFTQDLSETVGVVPSSNPWQSPSRFLTNHIQTHSTLIFEAERVSLNNLETFNAVLLIGTYYASVWHIFSSWLDSPSGPRPPLWGSSTTFRHTPHSVGTLWTSDWPVAETSTWQHTTLIRKRHPCPRRDSNSQSQRRGGHRPMPYTARRLGSAVWHLRIHISYLFHNPEEKFLIKPCFIALVKELACPQKKVLLVSVCHAYC
jgi:hypothetical protein